MHPIDLRSDTVTRPSPAMRDAMARAEVGDDVYGEDPTVNLLQQRVAELLGKEAALFVPSGTMANVIAVRVHTRPGDEVILEHNAHTLNNEGGAAAAVCGVQVRALASGGASEQGILDAGAVLAAIRPDDAHYPHSALLCVENTHNAGGGTVWPLAALRSVCDAARGKGLGVHLDGARLFNAVVAGGTSAREYAACVDSVSVCLSKGLGAPVGSLLAGSRDLVRQAHRVRKMLGGGMRQAGVLAAAGLHALEHNVARLADDHRRARRLQEGAAGLGWVAEVRRPPTNIVMLDLAEGYVAADLLAAMREVGVLAGAFGPRRIRLVTHLEIGDADVEQVLQRLASLRPTRSGAAA